jgi:hypothetical protein
MEEIAGVVQAECDVMERLYRSSTLAEEYSESHRCCFIAGKEAPAPTGYLGIGYQEDL